MRRKIWTCKQNKEREDQMKQKELFAEEFFTGKLFLVH